MKTADVIVVGGGPSGSIVGAYLAQAGIHCLIFESEAYPRFHIGESLLPASMPLFKEIGFYSKLSSGKYIEKYGARFIDYRNDDEIYFGFNDGLNPDIPMAFEVERCDFDRDILEHAASLGVEVHQPEKVLDVTFLDSHVEVRTNKEIYQAQFLVDTTGRDCVLGKKLMMRKEHRDLNNFAVFAHFSQVERYPGKHEGDITIGLLTEKAWTWIIPFKGNKTSVGVVASNSQRQAGESFEAYFHRRVLSSPRVQRMMSQARRETEFICIANYSHGNESFVGDRWICAGDAAAFLDPIFSSGVHVAVTTGRLAALAVLRAVKEKTTLRFEDRHREYEETVRRGVRRFHNLISLFYQGGFVGQMKKTLTRENMRAGFTSAVAGDMWNENNFLFEKGVL